MRGEWRHVILVSLLTPQQEALAVPCAMGGADRHSGCGKKSCHPSRRKKVPKETRQGQDFQDFPVAEHSSRDAGR